MVDDPMCECGHPKSMHGPMPGAEERYPMECHSEDPQCPDDPECYFRCICLDFEEELP